MVKKFSVECDFGGQKSPVELYIGLPEQEHHPLFFQSSWLSKERGGTIPSDVMESMQKLKDLAEKNHVSFEDLCFYAMNSSLPDSAGDIDEGQFKQILDNQTQIAG